MRTDVYGIGEDLRIHPSVGAAENEEFRINRNEGSNCRFLGLWSRLTTDEVQTGVPADCQEAVAQSRNWATKGQDLRGDTAVCSCFLTYAIGR